jgi:hypothetical protein
MGFWVLVVEPEIIRRKRRRRRRANAEGGQGEEQPTRRSPMKVAVIILVMVATLAVLVVIVVNRSGPAPVGPGTQATRIVGPLSTRGTQIVDQGTGLPVRLLGIGDTNMVPGTGPSLADGGDACGAGWAPLKDAQIARVRFFGFNSFRIGVSWSNLEPEPPSVLPDGSLEHHWNDAYLQALGEEIREFGQHDIAVILDMHRTRWSPAIAGVLRRGAKICEGAGLPAWLYPNLPRPAPQGIERELSCQFFRNSGDPSVPVGPFDGFVEAWRQLAGYVSRFQNVVGADMINEPTTNGFCGAKEIQLAEHYEVIGHAIHTADPNLLLIFEDNPYGRYVDAGKALLSEPNVPRPLYSFHFYPRNVDSGLQVLSTVVQRSRQWQVPLWLGEMNPILKSSDAEEVESLAQVLAYCKRNNINWSYWNIGILQGQLAQGQTDILEDLRRGF